jgi:formylglycine-generating enzyme required for sulfatase activity
MGVVYRACQQALNRRVALKMVLAGSHAGMEARLRFQIEAVAIARLQHPNIVVIHEIGTHAGVPYFSQELLEGGTLRDRLAAGPIPPLETARLIGLLARAVHFAHLRSIVHRDLKPANILFAADGTPKIVDFGLAKRLDGSFEHTQEGGLLGTPSYMSPEQAARARDVGPATDVYSLGAIYYEMLTGILPFPGDSLPNVLHKLRHDDPPAPRQVRADIPRDLETICLKCLKKDPGQRYASAQDLADDIERWTRHEPIQARPVSSRERALKWTRRHPVRALVAVFMLITLAASLWIHERQQAAQARALVESLTTAETARVPEILRQLTPYQRRVRGELQRLVRSAPDDSIEHLHASLALADDDATQRDYLKSRLLTATPDELAVIRDSLKGETMTTLWPVLQDPAAGRDRRFRAACGLAASADSNDDRWTEAGPVIAEALVRENLLALGKWTELLRPIRAKLIGPLVHVFRTSGTPSERNYALSLLADFAADRPELLVDLLLDTNEEQFGLLWPRLRKQKDQVVSLLRKELGQPLPTEDDVIRRDVQARRQAWAAAALLQLMPAEDAWSLLQHSADPARRTYLLHGMARLGVAADSIVSRIESESDVSARRALIQSLGELTEEQLLQLDPDKRRRLVCRLVAWYRDEADPGIHSSVDWLLRSPPVDGRRKPDWKAGQQLDRIDTELATGEPVSGRRWFITAKEGHTLAIIPKPDGPYRMGSLDKESGRLMDEEAPQLMAIPRSFAIATREVTVAQFQRFLDDPSIRRTHSFDRALSPADDGPVLALSWFEAAQYCNWLSKLENIPESDWCYPTNIDEGMKLPADYLHRKGYRLPTEAEWEYACRAGAVTSRFYGTSGVMLREYAWYSGTANKRAFPVALLKPNDFGLFDMYGNAMEWCQDRGRRSLSPPDQVRIDDEDTELRVTIEQTRVLRGGSFWYLEPSLRSAYRDHQRPVGQVIAVGVRVARTMP